MTKTGQNCGKIEKRQRLARKKLQNIDNNGEGNGKKNG